MHETCVARQRGDDNYIGIFISFFKKEQYILVQLCKGKFSYDHIKLVFSINMYFTVHENSMVLEAMLI